MYPDWIKNKYRKFVNGRYYLGLSEDRLENRKFIYDKLNGNVSLSQIDSIIDFFKDKYTTSPWISLPKKTRKQLYVEKCGKCYYCGKKISYEEMTVEHVIPRAAGGTDTEDNYEIACAQCNQEKCAELSLIINMINKNTKESLERLPQLSTPSIDQLG